MTVEKVPFVDLRAQYERHKQEFEDALHSVIERTAFIGGSFVKDFELSFARRCEVEHCVGVANGTDAIYILLRMLGIGGGDEVITTAASWISTSETISQSGATPIFVDVDEYSNIDPAGIEAKISARTKAIIPVHLYGQPARMDEIAAIAQRRGLFLIEDCAQAHFARFAGKLIGTFGHAATFSFYPGKNLGAYGDAGALITNDAALARKCRMYANHGALVKHQHEMEGINSRLDALQASLLSAKLPHVAAWTQARRKIASLYDELLAGIAEVRAPKVHPRAEHVYHLYVIRAQRRDELKVWLADHGIETQIHYPTALPLLPAYSRLGVTARDIPNAARNQSEILSLPMYAEMPERYVHLVVQQIREFYARERA